MKAFGVRLFAKPSAMDGAGNVTTHLSSPREINEARTIGALAELEPLSTELAAKLGEPCVVWIIAERERERKPRGFEAETSRIAKVYRGGAA